MKTTFIKETRTNETIKNRAKQSVENAKKYNCK